MHPIGTLAQLVEQWTENPCVPGSIPGGFGVAKNLSSWAFKETDCTVHPYVKKLILNFFDLKKPILSLCVSPTIVAKSLINKAKDLKLTIGSTQHASEYSISEFQTALRQMDVNTINTSICLKAV